MTDNTILTVSGYFERNTTDTPAGNTVITAPPTMRRRKKAASEQEHRRCGHFEA